MRKQSASVMDPVWFVLVDAQHCRLIRAQRNKLGSLRLVEVDRLENELPVHERGRPMALAGMTGHTFAALHHDDEEMDRRFVSQIVAWLAAQSRRRGIDRLTLWATPRIVGILRKSHLGPLAGRLDLRVGNLMHIDNGRLTDHQRIRGLFTASAGFGNTAAVARA